MKVNFSVLKVSKAFLSRRSSFASMYDVNCLLFRRRLVPWLVKNRTPRMTKLYSFLNIIYCVTSSLTLTNLTWRQADILTHKEIKHNSMLAKSEALGVSSILFYVNKALFILKVNETRNSRPPFIRIYKTKLLIIDTLINLYK